MRWLKIIGIAFLVFALLLVGGVVYVMNADLGGFKPLVERAISEATGRQLTIAGRFEPDIGLTSSLIATDVTFANPDWSEEAAMVHADHFAVSIDLWSLIRQPVIVRNLEFRGVRVGLEVDDKGRANWELGLAEESDKIEEPAEFVPIVFEHVEVRDVEIAYRNQPAARKLTFVIDHFTEHPDKAGLLAFDVQGRLNERPIEIAGHIGPMNNLLAGKNVRQRLSGHIGDLRLELEGLIGELATLSQPDLRLELHADELPAITAMFGFNPMGEGSLNAVGRLSPALEGVSMELEVELGAMQASVTGTVDALIDTKVLDVSVAASGPDLAPLDAIIKGLPEGAFNIAGRLQRRHGTYGFDNVKAKVGENEASLNGTLGDLPRLTGTSIAFEAAGPDLSVFSDLAEVPLTPGPYAVEGRLEWQSGALKLTGVNASIGENRLALDGVLGPPPGLIGTKLRIRARGPDFSAIPIVTSYADAPAEAFNVEGQFGIKAEHYEILALHAQLGELELRANGVLGLPPQLKGTDLRIEASGSDLSRLTPYARVDGLPAEPYSVHARLRARDSKYLLDEMIAEFGSARIEMNGEIGTSADLSGTALEFKSSIPDPAILEPMAEGLRFPKAPLKSSARVRLSKDSYEVQEMRVQIGDATVRLDGVVGLGSDLSGTDLKFDADAPDLSLFALYVEDLNLPRQAFSTSGQVRVNERGYEFADINARLGDATLRLNGTLGRRPKRNGTHISLEAEGPDLAKIAAIANLTVPAVSFRIAARTEPMETGVRLRETSAKIGEDQIKLSGVLGEPPKFIGTNLDFTAKGPNLDLISEFAHLDRSLSGDPYKVSGQFDGAPETFRLKRLDARLGDSNLSGSFDLDLRNKPNLEGEFSSRYLDIGVFLAEEQSDAVSEKESAKTQPAASAPKSRSDSKKSSRYLIPDTPIDLSALDAVNVDIRFAGEKVLTKMAQLSKVELGVHLRDGNLELNPISVRDSVRGGVSGTASLRPLEKGFSVAIDGKTEKLRLGLLSAKGEDPANQPPLDSVVVFNGVGSSLHEIAASGNGRIELMQGRGRINNSMLNLLANDISLELFNALNPFRKSDPHTTVECGVYGAKVVDGVVTLDPLAARTGKMTVVGSGRIDFKTEKIDFAWNTRPRQGIGISASAITNPFVRLGGTLSSPTIGLKPTEAALSTGAAVATGGLSILAKGLFDRLRAEENVCKAALEQMKGGSESKTLFEKLLPSVNIGGQSPDRPSDARR